MQKNTKRTKTRRTTKRAAGRKRLRREETVILDRLQKELRRGDCDFMAQAINEELFSAHRGAIEEEDTGLIYVFSNDGFSADIRSRLEVAKLVKTLEDANFEVVAFGLSEGGYTWAMEVRADWDDLDLLDAAVWDAWFRACQEVSGGKFHPFPNRLAEMLKAAA